jgi:hypothetical protein
MSDHTNETARIHEVICGSEPDTIHAVQGRLAAEYADSGVESWLVDPDHALEDQADKVGWYAHTAEEINAQLKALPEQCDDRESRLVALCLPRWIPGDERLGLPLLAVTVLAAPTVLGDRAHRRTMERVLREDRCTGISVRMVVPDLRLPSFGGSFVIPSALRDRGRMLCCDEAPDAGEWWC